MTTVHGSFLLPSGQASGSCFLDPRWGVGNHCASVMGLSLVSLTPPRLSVSDSMIHSLGMGRSWNPLQGPVHLSLWSCKKKAEQAAGASGAVFLSFSLFSENILSWMKQCYFILIFPLTCETGFYMTAIKKVLKYLNSTPDSSAEFRDRYWWIFSSVISKNKVLCCNFLQ